MKDFELGYSGTGIFPVQAEVRLMRRMFPAANRTNRRAVSFIHVVN